MKKLESINKSHKLALNFRQKGELRISIPPFLISQISWRLLPLKKLIQVALFSARALSIYKVYAASHPLYHSH